MIALVGIVLGIAGISASVVRFDPASHKPTGSRGCGSTSPYKLGTTTTAHGKVRAVRRCIDRHALHASCWHGDLLQATHCNPHSSHPPFELIVCSMPA